MNILDFSIVAIYLAALLVMGFMFRTQTSKSDYFLGGKSLGWKPLALSVMATQLSAISFVSAPAFVGLREGGGMQWLSYELGVPLAMILILSTILPKLYRAGVVSIYDYLENRFGRSTRVLISIVFQFSRAFATGIMIYAVSLILQGTMGIEAWQAIVLTGVITVLYSLQGGMKAVVYGDAVQMIIIVLGTIACIGFGLYHLGGVDTFVANVDSTRLQAIKFDSIGFSGDGFGFLPMIFGGVVLYASYYGCDQTQAQRALSAKDPQNLRYMILANGFIRFPITLLYCFSGLIVGTLAMSDATFFDKIPSDNPDWMMPIFILNYLPHGLIGLLVVAILAAAMSSLSSAINSLAAVSIEDYSRIVNKDLSQASYLKLAKYMGLVWGVVTLVLSLYAGNIAPTIIEAINKVGSLFYGPILAVFLIAVISKLCCALHVNIGLITGVLFNLLISVLLPDIFWFWWNFIGFVVTSVVALLASAAMPREVNSMTKIQNVDGINNSILTRMDLMLLVAMFVSMVLVCLAIPLIFS
ncbi:sodium:solute symporter [Shewanella sp. ALD9]|jgi:sodium-coupled monocarboxylate transporter 8/12|uniref:sodium:solute symporter n=1 Tax=Shewanella sp. ALD9 TaxID=2058330 RepID=UPI000C32AFE8|nr:sodium:solute symporter [Shewanella sp. ALD9]PKH33618.1 sodium transporter [Shewanella sp. ALD9]